MNFAPVSMSRPPIRHVKANRAAPDFAPRQFHDLTPSDAHIRDLEAQLEMLREARRVTTYAYERDEIESRRVQLGKELRAARNALHPKPLSPSFFRRFLAALLHP